ncbi:MAG TPA: hypothetical protein VGY54_00925 [Polyangiaceae bacterium]|nr:hypothetical protein [Polyangiaceae bacterium]
MIHLRAMPVPFDPEYVFSHHTATPAKLADYDAIHAGAKRFAEIILAHTPAGEDQATALRLLREATMIACAGIALDGRLTR